MLLKILDMNLCDNNKTFVFNLQQWLWNSKWKTYRTQCSDSKKVFGPVGVRDQ